MIILLKIIKMAKDVLYARRNGNIRREQAAIDQLNNYLTDHDINLNAASATEQVTEHLKKTSIAAMMNGIV